MSGGIEVGEGKKRGKRERMGKYDFWRFSDFHWASRFEKKKKKKNETKDKKKMVMSCFFFLFDFLFWILSPTSPFVVF